MKRYIRASSISADTLKQAVEFAKSFKGYQIDESNHIIVIPLARGLSKETFMKSGMIGDWFLQNGFDISWSHGDVEYITQPEWRNSRGWNRASGHKAYLRDRDIATITWR